MILASFIFSAIYRYLLSGFGLDEWVSNYDQRINVCQLWLSTYSFDKARDTTFYRGT